MNRDVLPTCFVLTIRHKDGSKITTERHTYNSAKIERLYFAIKCPDFRLLCMKAHSGTDYLNNGRFV